MKNASHEYVLHHGDCIKKLKEIKDSSVDIVVTSPPYNIGLKYKSYKDNLSNEEYLKWTKSWISEVKRILKHNGSFFLNLGSALKNQMTPLEIAVITSQEFKLQNTFHWIKSISIQTKEGITLSTGHFKPINSARYVNDSHEYVFQFTLNGDVKLNRLDIGVPYQDKSNIKRWTHSGDKDMRCRGNTWFIPYKTIHRRSIQRPHPATFPVQLAKNCILLHGVNKSTVVCDPFVGLGNSATAALEAGARKFIGIDIELDYLNYTKESLELVCKNTNSAKIEIH